MNNDIDIAKKLLGEDSSITLAVVNKKKTFVSRERGIKPIFSLYKNDPEFLFGASVADKVTGRASAFVLVAGGVVVLHSGIISEKAFEVLKEANITVTFDKQVDCIINRTGDGICPMEQATKGCYTPSDAINAIEKKLYELSKKQV